jgi:hypothetical protein
LLAGACGPVTNPVDEDPLAPSLALTAGFPANAAALVAEAVRAFECAFAGYVVAAGLTSDELSIAGGNPDWFSYDRRAFATAGSTDRAYALSTCKAHERGVVGVYRPLAQARSQADRVLALLQGASDAQVPNRYGLMGTAAAYAGYSYLLLGEGMCSASFDGGPLLPPAQIFGLAAARFDAAVAAALVAGNAATLGFARVGRARAALNLNDWPQAIASAMPVPAGFVWNATFSATNLARFNFAFYENRRDIVVVEGPYRNLNDPRVNVTDTGRDFPGTGLRIWYQEKYQSLSAPIPIARYQEAQLIIAEALAWQGNVAAAVNVLNARRAQLGLPPLVASTAAQALIAVLEERRRELFLESHRLMDIKRYNLPLSPPAGAAYPLGGVYGSHTCYPMPS